MCEEKQECQKPEELKDKPENCTPEQIEKCHGDSASHPCCEKEEKEGEE